MKSNFPICPHMAPEQAGEVDRVKLLPGNANSCGKVRAVTWEPWTLKPLIIEKGAEAS